MDYMDDNFENSIFYITLIIYFIANITNTVLMMTKTQFRYKVLCALLPFPLLFLISSVNVTIFKVAIDINNPPFGTDYSGYFTGLIIVLGVIMMLFYIINITYLIIKTVKGNMK